MAVAAMRRVAVATRRAVEAAAAILAAAVVEGAGIPVGVEAVVATPAAGTARKFETLQASQSEQVDVNEVKIESEAERGALNGTPFLFNTLAFVVLNQGRA